MTVDVLQSLVFGVRKALGQVIDWLISGDGVLLFSSLKCIEGPNFRFFIITTKAVLQARRSSDDHKSSLATTKFNNTDYKSKGPIETVVWILLVTNPY